LSNEKLIRKQYEELIQIFPGLKLFEDTPGRWVIRGVLSFSAKYQDKTINDAFSMLITLPEDYPESPPIVQETGGRIPPDFHQYPDRTLCLGAPAEVWRRFKKDPRLITFVSTMVVEYLYGYAYYEKYGKLPFGELSHGSKGIREYYQEIFNTNDVMVVLSILKPMAEGNYRGHLPCPCGSGKISRKCHGTIILDLVKNQPKERFIRDFEIILYSLNKEEIERFDKNILPKPLSKILERNLDKMHRERAKLKKYQ